MSHKDYLAGLKDYWLGRPRTAIEHISKVIADRPTNDAHLPLYRLWIELLAGENDRAALHSLAGHLQQRSKVEAEYLNTYFALRGLIDFELEQIQSAELKVAALRSVNNMYAWELKFRLAHRCGMCISSYPLKRAKEAIAFDFVFARSYLLHLYQQRKFDTASRILKAIDQNFEGNPLGNEIRLHRYFDQHNFVHALRYAHELNEQFPSHSQYPVYLALLQVKNRHYREAEQTLVKCETIYGPEDVDVVSLKATLYYQIFQDSAQKKNKEKCIVQLKKAINSLEMNGYSTTEYSKMYHDVLGTVEKNMTQIKSWMLHLNQTDFADLMIKDEEEIQSIKRTIDPSAEVGDLVFIVARDAVYKKEGSSNVRLGAVYQVVSDSLWHPIDGHQVQLELVSKPAISIRLPVAFEEQIKKNQTLTFEMDDHAFNQIYSTIEEYASDESSVYTLKTELEKIRQVS